MQSKRSMFVHSRMATQVGGAGTSALPESIGQAADVLVCPYADNTVRWRPGERLHHLFEQRCDQFARDGDPGHLAVDSPQGKWTYAEVDARANRIARYLREQGVGAGDVVALLFDKSVHSYASMLAVLKIHAAYVPLDPGFPSDRIAFIAQDAGASSILTTSVYRELVENAAPAVLCVDEAAAQIDSLPADRLTDDEVGQPVSDLCYIIYTSGSTGRPKGVPIEHASIGNFVRVAAEVYGYRESDRVYQGLTLAFDFAVEEIWVPLAVGATLLPNHTGSSLLGEDLANFLRTRRATAMCCVPTLLATIDHSLPDLRLLIVSGEACPRDLITRWHTPERTILNAYGPTETTVSATLSRPRPGEPVNIGPPLPTYSVVILVPDAAEALPFGETGEIGIAGIGLARGYLNRDDQTRKAFIPDFIGIPNNPSGQIYRTGDLGRVNERGEVEYLGRIDTQVKIRGYRIELTEIESVILSMPQVAQAVVNTFEPMPGVKELVAYYTLKDEADPLPPEEMARELRTLLPSYMVPAYYEPLQVMPMLASDKADRKALPAPSGARMNAAARDFVEPAGGGEQQIAAVLGRVLNLEKVSVEDHFFDDLGANSLLMAQFSAKLRSELGMADFSMREIYAHPTVRGLAACIGSVGQKRAPLRKERNAHIATDLQYVTCGAMQLLVFFGLMYLGAVILWEGYHWIIKAPSLQVAYGHSVTFALAMFALALLLPVVVKWTLIGRWKEEEFPVWSAKYLRFWMAKQLVSVSPMALFAGTPMYNAYLKLLGARVGWRAVILSRSVPVCTDLLTIGDGALVSRNVQMPGYRAESGRIRTGSITLGRDTFVGEGSFVDIDTVMGDGSELAHASSVLQGQRLAAGRSHHGSPAQPADDRFRALEGGKASVARMLTYTLAQLGAGLFIFGPLPFLIAYYFLGIEGTQEHTTIGEAMSNLMGGPATLTHVGPIMGWTSLLFLVALLTGLVAIVTWPRVVNAFLKEGKVYPLYGIHFYLQRTLQGMSNSKFYNELFGDSSFIVHYLAAIGYRFLGVEQTGSNFGVAQQHDNPFLCEIGRGTMVSDGLYMVNLEHSTSTFRSSRVSIGARNFFGNSIWYPPQGKTGENCLLGTKVMIPIHGPVRENTGLLGSPSFEIPRSVLRDNQFDFYKKPAVLRQRLKLKDASNIGTMLLFLLVQVIAMNLAVVGWYYSYGEFVQYGPLYLTGLGLALMMLSMPYYILVDRASRRFRPLQPKYCSIYDEYYWQHERHWKMNAIVDRVVLGMFNGTPFKGMALRALGVRVGKKLFDDGCGLSEKTLVTIGDHCTLNRQSFLQAHSLEDGTFKSDHIILGNGCTVGGNCLVHYGVVMEDESTLEPDSFLMKGERTQARAIWQGNPAKELMAPVEVERMKRVA